MNPETILKSLEKIEGGIGRNADQVRELSDRVSSLEQRGFSIPGERTSGGIGPVAEFLKSSGLANFLNGAPSTGRVSVKSSIGGMIEARKALISIQGAEVTTGQYNVQAQRLEGLFNMPMRQLSLLDVLPSIQVASNAVDYVKLTDSFAHAAALQAYESDQKAEQSVPTATGTAKIATIAAWVQASKQLMSDVPMLRRQIADLLGYGVLAKLESQLVAGTGDIAGLVPNGTAITTTGEPADRISDAASQLIASGWNPGVVVMHPTDWHKIRSERSATEGMYIAGTWAQPAQPSIWGLPVVLTPSIAVDKVLVLDPSQVALLDRESVSVEASRETGTNFTSNQITILGEMRAGLAIFAPRAVGVVDLGLVA